MKLLLAPMATLTHQGLRELVSSFGGCDEYYTEMINAASLIHGGQFERFYILNNVEPDKIVWQLTGSKTEDMAEATKIVKDLGGIGIDINMGCAAPAIYKFGAGISWMLKPIEETAKMLNAVKKECKDSRLSVKIRLGDENYKIEDLFIFSDMLLSEGVSQIVLHPRTRKEKYARPPKYSALKDFCEYVKNKDSTVQVIGNGGVNDFSSYQNLIVKAPKIDGVMIGRAAVQKPWIFAEIKATESIRTQLVAKKKSSENLILKHSDKKELTYTPIKIDLYEVAKKYLFGLDENQPKEFYPTRAKRFFEYYIDNFFFGHSLKAKIQNTDNRDEQLLLLYEYLERNPNERFKEVIL